MGTNLLYRGSPSGVAKLIMRDELQDGTSKPNGLARLDNLCRHSYSEAMEVHLSSDQLTKLANLARDKGRAADVLAQEAISRYLEEEARFVEAVKLGEAQLDRGEYLTHEEVGARVQRLLKS